MVLRSSQSASLQYVPVAELWSGLYCGSFRDEVFGVIRGYIDESYEGKKLPRFFTLSCSLAQGGDWEFIEAAWKWVIERKNRELIKQGRKPISRYHAADCFNRNEEFEGWSKEERHRFVMSLFEIFRAFPTSHVAISISAKDIHEILPKNQSNPIHFAYYILLRLMMMTIGDYQSDLRMIGKKSLIYERCGEFGESMLRGFNEMMDEPLFEYRDSYITIAPMGWEKCIPLQPADLVAYEFFHDAKRRFASHDMNKSLKALSEMPNFRFVRTQVDRQHLVLLKEMMMRESLWPSDKTLPEEVSCPVTEP